MFPAPMSNSTSLSEEATVSSGNRLLQDFSALNPNPLVNQHPLKIKKKRSLPGNPDPDAEVIALSPKTLLATNRFVCEICNKGFQRDQNLQLHRRGHNLPWKLKQRNSKEIKKRAYVCPEPSCVHHHPSRALGDLTGIKKHYCRKHGEKKWKCEKCSKIYAVQSDWKAHSKTCGTREYRCDCGTLFSRKDSFITHRAFCDALAEESARLSAHQLVSANPTHQTSLLLQNPHSSLFTPLHHHQIPINPWDPPLHHHHHQNPTTTAATSPLQIKPETHHFQLPSSSASSLLFQEPSPFHTLSNPATSPATPTPSSHHLSATALLQKAATVGAAQAAVSHSQMSQLDMTELGAAADSVTQRRGSSFLGNLSTWQKHDRLTRDFLGLTGDDAIANGNVANGTGAAAAVNVSMNMREMLTYTGGVGLHQYGGGERDHSLLKPHGFGFCQQPPPASETWGDC